MSEPKGPVHLDLPEDVALAPARETASGRNPATKLPSATDGAIARAGELVAQAARPIAVLGSSAMRMAEPDLLRAVVERHNLPFATTTMAKGMIDEEHPLSVGCIERACRQIQRKFLRSADLIVGLGYDTVEVEYEAWIGDVPLLNIDIERADVARSVKVAHEVTGDLDASLTKLAALPASRNAWTLALLDEHRRKFQAALRPTTNTFTAHAAIDAVRRALPREGLLSFDVGAHTHQIASQWTAYAPKTFHITNGWSSMGFGLPGAIAAKLARPDLPVVCLIGDGCFQMTCGEVATAKRLGLSLPVVVLDDRWLALIKVKQIRRQFPLYGTELQADEYTEPPEHYFGVPALGVRSADKLEDAVRTALRRNGPTVIEAVVDSDHYVDTVYD
jgi:acetolactate synthase-1/2/3 large subunit